MDKYVGVCVCPYYSPLSLNSSININVNVIVYCERLSVCNFHYNLQNIYPLIDDKVIGTHTPTTKLRNPEKSKNYIPISLHTYLIAYQK